MFPLFFLSIGFSALISFIITPLVRNFFVSKSWVEDPQIKQLKTGNATASSPAPRGGGIPIFLSFMLTSLILLPSDRHLLSIIFAAFVALVVGVIDDIRDLKPSLRFLFNIVVALIVVSSGIGIAYLSNPFGGVIDLSQPQLHFNFFGPRNIWLLADLFAVFWIVWCSNIVGWSAGVEGQLPGFVVIAAIVIGILGLNHSQDISQWPVIVLAGATSGAYLGFLPLNFFPQTIQPGYSGKSLAGFLLAVLSILSGAKVATLILVLGIPMLDAVFVLLRRIIRHRSLLRPNAIHLHHHLLKLGWSRPRIAITYWLLSFMLGAVSLLLNSQQKFYAFLGLFFLFGGIVIQLYRRT